VADRDPALLAASAAASTLFVSPSTSTASGRSASSTGASFSITAAIW
jgi:hypothetical protein